MKIIVGESLPYYHEKDFLQAFIWYKTVLIPELVYTDLSVGKVNMNCRGPLWGQLTKSGLLQIVDNPIPKKYQDGDSLSKIAKELLGEKVEVNYHSQRDLSELLTVVDLGIPVLEKPNPYHPEFPTVQTRLENALGDSPFLGKKSGKLQRIELARSLILPRFEIATVDDIMRYRDMKAVRDLSEQIEQVATTCARSDKLKLESVREFLIEVNAKLHRDIYGTRPGLPRTILESTALWLGELILSSIVPIPLPISPVIDVVEKVRERIKDKESWAYLLLSIGKDSKDSKKNS